MDAELCNNILIFMNLFSDNNQQLFEPHASKQLYLNLGANVTHFARHLEGLQIACKLSDMESFPDLFNQCTSWHEADLLWPTFNSILFLLTIKF